MSSPHSMVGLFAGIGGLERPATWQESPGKVAHLRRIVWRGGVSDITGL